MTYSSGGLIQTIDYNGFITPGWVNVGPGFINNIWGRHDGGVLDSGWGQSQLAVVSTGGTVAATNWASLCNTLSLMGLQTGTTITSRSNPTAGSTISVLANVQADINSCNTNRGNASSAGTLNQSFSGTTSKTTATGSGNNAWTITFTHTVNLGTADQARYFWNAGGIVRIYYNKSSTGTDNDPDWNTFVGKVGSLAFVGRVNGAAQTILGTSYTGTSRFNGTGGTQTTLATTTGWYSLTAGAAATTIFQLNDDVSPYTGDTIITTAAKNAASTVLTLTTTWNSPARTGAGQSTNISGGSPTNSPYTGFGTAPTTMVLTHPPASNYLSVSWITPIVTASVA